MSFQKPKLVLRQIVLIICLLLALLAVTPAIAKSQHEFDLIHSDRGGKNPLASIKIDSVNASTPGQLVDVPILIRNSAVFGSFELEIDFCYQKLPSYGAQRGEAISHITNQRYDWEYFSYRILPYTDTLYKLALYGLADLPDGPEHVGVPLAPNSDYVSLVVMKFQAPDQCFLSGTFLPIIFEWEGADCSENTFTDSTGDTLYVSQDSLQYDTTVCPHGPSIIPSLEFSNGGVSAFYPSPPICRGDIDLDHIPYTPADYLLFHKYLLYGDSVLVIDPEEQSANSDVNWDGYRWSIADYIHLGRVIQHDAPQILDSIGLLNGTCRISIGTQPASPHDTVALPFGYFSNQPEGWKSIHGVALRIGYNPNELIALGMDFTGSQIENWQNVAYNISPGEIRFFATPEYLTTSPSDSLAYPGTDTLLLGKIVFEVGDVDTPYFVQAHLLPDTGIYLKSNNVAGIDQELTRMDWIISPLARGDLNINYIAYEVADFLLFVQFLDQGPDVFWYSVGQYPASDINADGINVTIADLVYMDRVIIKDAPPIPLSFDHGYLESQTDKMTLGTASANPGDTVSLSLSFDNTLPACGISFKIVFDSTLLSVQNVDTSGTRLQGWTEVHTIVKPGALFMHAMPNYLGVRPQDQALPPGSGILAKINFVVSDQAPTGIVIPVEFQNDLYWQSYWGHYNAYTQDGLNFIKPTTVSGWISVATNVLRGDVNKDGVIDMEDVVYLIDYLFTGGSAPDPLALGDANCDGVVDIADVVYLINYIFIGGPPPGC